MLRGKKRPLSGRGKNQGGRGNIWGTKHCEPAKRGKIWCAWGERCHEKSVRRAAGEKRREALRKTTAAQRPLKIGREAGKTVLCPVYEAPRIKRPPSYGKNKARSGANCGRCWARSRENFGMWASCGMTGASRGALCMRRGRCTGETFYLCRGKKRLCSDLRNRYLTPA